MIKNIARVFLLLLILGMSESVFAACCPPTLTTTISPSGSRNFIDFSPSGCLSVGGGNNDVLTYAQTSLCTYSTTATSTALVSSFVNDVAFSPDNCLAVAAGLTAVVYGPTGPSTDCVYDTPTTTITTTTTASAVAFSPLPDACLAVGDSSGFVNIYSKSTPGTCNYNTVPTTSIITGTVTHLAFSPTDNCLAVGDTGGTVSIYPQISGCTYNTTPSQSFSLGAVIVGVAFSPNGCLAFTNDSGLTVIYAPLLDCTYVHMTTITPVTFSGPIAFSPDGSCFYRADGGNVYAYPLVTDCVYSTIPVLVAAVGFEITSIAISPDGCLGVAHEAANVNVYTPFSPASTLQVVATPILTTICSGGSATIVSEATGGDGGPYTYTWVGPNGFTANTQTITITNATESNAGQYLVTVADGTTCIAADLAILNVDTLGVALCATPDTICSGQSSTLTATITGGIAPYTVTFSGFPPVVTSSTTVTQIVSPTTTTNYTVTVTDSSSPPCTATSAIVTVTVNPTPTPAITTVSANCNSTVTITGTGTAGDTIEVFNGATQIATPIIVPGGGNFSITTIPLAPGTYTTLTLTELTPAGCSATIPVPSVTVNPLLGVTITGTSALCAGSTLTLTANPTGGVSPYTYAWTGPNGFTATTQTINIPNATQANAGQYTVTVTDSSSPACTASASTCVVIQSIAISLSASPQTICAGQSSTLTALIAGGLAPYTVTFSGFPPVVTSSTTVTQLVTPLTTTNYTVTVTDSSSPACTATSNTATVTVNPSPTPTISTVSANCTGTVTITGTGTPGDTIEVFNGATQIAVPIIIPVGGTFSITTMQLPAGTYTTLTVLELGPGCSGSVAVPSVTVNPTVGVTIVGSSIVCQGATLTLTANAAGGTGSFVNYLWTGPNGFMQTGPSNTITIPNVTLANAGSYSVTVTDSAGCTASASSCVIVANIGVALSASPLVLCSGSSTLTATIFGGVPPYTVTFSGFPPVITSSTTVNQTVTPSTTTTYTVSVTDSGVCSATSNPVTVTVALVTAPVINTVSSTCEGIVTITGTTDPGDIVNVFLSGLPIATPVIAEPDGSFVLQTVSLAIGTYTLTVTATNSAGCSASTPITVTVECSPTTITLTDLHCRVTRTSRPLLTGTTTPLTGVNIFANGENIGVTLSNGTGNFYFIPQFPLPDGPYTFFATTLMSEATFAVSNTVSTVIDTRPQSNASSTINAKYCPTCPGA